MSLFKKLNKFYEILKHRHTIYETTLAAATMVRNEAPYLREWIEYYKIIGVEKFYIFDNYSTDNIKEVLHTYILSGEVEYTLFPSVKIHSSATQVDAFNTAVKQAKFKTRWLAIFDVDENL